MKIAEVGNDANGKTSCNIIIAARAHTHNAKQQQHVKHFVSIYRYAATVVVAIVRRNENVWGSNAEDERESIRSKTRKKNMKHQRNRTATN